VPSTSVAAPVAVKTLDAALHADPLLRSAIRREARAAASITHPHVTQVYDFGEEPLPTAAWRRIS